MSDIIDQAMSDFAELWADELYGLSQQMHDLLCCRIPNPMWGNGRSRASLYFNGVEPSDSQAEDMADEIALRIASIRKKAEDAGDLKRVASCLCSLWPNYDHDGHRVIGDTRIRALKIADNLVALSPITRNPGHGGAARSWVYFGMRRPTDDEANELESNFAEKLIAFMDAHPETKDLCDYALSLCGKGDTR